MRSVFVIAKKESRSLRKEKTLVLSILIQLVIASFASFLIVGLASVADPYALSEFDVQGVDIGIVTQGNSTLIDSSNLHTTIYRDFAVAEDAFYRGGIDAILVVPDVAINGSELINIHIYLPENEFSAAIVTLQLKEPLEGLEQRVREVRTKRLPDYKPINLNLPEQQASSFYFELIYLVLIPLLVFTPAFISGGLVLDSITEEYEQKTIELLLTSPVTFMDVIKGKMLVAVLIAPIQAFAWIVLLALNGIRIDNIFLILVLVSLTAFILVVTGAFIAVLFKDRRMSQLFYSFVLVTLFLLSQVVSGSPMHLVTKLAMGSAGGTYVWLYLGIAVVLYAALRRVFV